MATAVTDRALSQLLYADGMFVHDPLGYLLARALNPKYVGGDSPRWHYRSDDPAEVSNYFEALAYLRPLIDAGMIILVPRAVEPVIIPGED